MVPSIALAESAMMRAAESPAGKIVTDWRGMFHALSARKVAVSVAPPTARMPIFLPIKSSGLRISLAVTKLYGKLLSEPEMITRSAP